MDFLPKYIVKYSEEHTAEENDLLKRIGRETHLQVNMPRMLSGHLQGRVLSLISKLIQPTYIVEVGTFTGYSALCMAEGLKPEGKLITIDISKELERRVNGYFSESKYASQIEMQIGDAAEILQTLSKGIDLAFIDADKANYALYYDLLLPKVRSGGLIIADNVLWSGKVADPTMQKKDKDTLALLTFNSKVKQDPTVEVILLPIRDGLLMARKK